jgi:hypothetical protein
MTPAPVYMHMCIRLEVECEFLNDSELGNEAMPLHRKLGVSFAANSEFSHWQFYHLTIIDGSLEIMCELSSGIVSGNSNRILF